MARPFFRNAEVATALAQICCHDNQLPQGAPTSPLVSNAVASRMDGAAIHLAKTFRLTYTRFADDLTFSTNLPTFPAAVAVTGTTHSTARIGPTLESLLQREGFSVNPDKVRLQNIKTRIEVTGLTVNRFTNTPRRYVRQVRAMLHAWEKHGLEGAQQEFNNTWDRKHRRANHPTFSEVVRGKLEFLQMVRGMGEPLVDRLWKRYAQLDPAFRTKTAGAWHDRVAAALWVLECESSQSQGTAIEIEGLGLLTCEHVLGPATCVFRRGDHLNRSPIVPRLLSGELDLALADAPIPTGRGLELNLNYRPSIGDDLRIAGFPNFQIADTGHFLFQRVAGIRQIAGRSRVLVDGPIAGGMSGGPVLDNDCRVVGIVVSGADTLSNSHLTERHGFIPAEVLGEFLQGTSPSPSC